MFFVIVLVTMFIALVVQHFIGPLPQIGARVLLMPLVMFYGALAFRTGGMLTLAFVGGLMWDALHVQIVDGEQEIGMGWSTVLYAVLCGLMSGFRPLFLRGRWEIHCLLSGVCTSLIVFAEYIMISIRRQPVAFHFDQEIWWRIGGAGLAALLLSPFVFFFLNYLGYLTGYDPRGEQAEKRL